MARLCAAADLAALIVRGDFKDIQLPFPPTVARRSRNQSTSRRRRRVTNIHRYTDRQLAWPKQRSQRTRGGGLHQRDHARGREHRGKRIAVFVRDRAGEICWSNDEFGGGASANFEFRHVGRKITEYNPLMQSVKTYDVAVIGAGVFGV